MSSRRKAAKSSSVHKDNFVRVRGARQNNLQNVDLDVPRDSFVVFTGVSGSGKSSIAFGTIYAEAQRRYFDSVAPYARRLLDQLPSPHVTEISGLPPAVALQQRRGEPTSRSSVGTLTTLSNSLRMLFSRAGDYPPQIKEVMDSDWFSPNTHVGACSACHGVGVIHSVTEESLVPDPNLTIREKAVAAWPGAWQGKNYRDILATLGYDIDKPWKDLPKKDREWILFTEEKPVVTVYAEREAHRIQRPYQGTYMSAAVYVLHTYASTNSDTLRKRVSQFMTKAACKECKGKKLNQQSLSVRFAGYDIAEMGLMPLAELAPILRGATQKKEVKSSRKNSSQIAELICKELLDRIASLAMLGLDHLSLDRMTPTLSTGELQRIRLSTQLRSGLFGVVYVLDEPSSGLHPSDTEALLSVLKNLKESGNSLFIVEHDMDIVKTADWIVDMGPGAGEHGGQLIYSGPVAGLESAPDSLTRNYLFPAKKKEKSFTRRKAQEYFKLSKVNRHNLQDLEVEIPIGVLTAVAGVSGAGKTTLISQVLSEAIAFKLGTKLSDGEESEEHDGLDESNPTDIAVLSNADSIKRLVHVDQKPIGRTPRSNLATYTGLFDYVRNAYAALPAARERGFNAGRFSFNVTGGRCENCEGEGFVSVELLFLPSVYAPCTACGGSRYNQETLEIKLRGLNIAQVLEMTVERAGEFFSDMPAVSRALKTLSDVGLGYLRLGQPATELSGGEAQRIKLATELQRIQHGSTLYILDEPTAGLHPFDTEKLMSQLHALAEAGNTVIVIENDMDVVAAADYVIDLGPGAGSQGGKIVASGTPEQVARSRSSKTGPYLAQHLKA
jgi:excinuclease ABC subunit A